MAGVVDPIVWQNLSVAGAFLLGAALGTVATLRIVRNVGSYLASLKKDPEA